MDKIKILIADDHVVVRKGICHVINEQNDMQVIAEAHDGIEALHLSKQTEPDIVILDVAMPKVNGIEAVAMIKEAVPDAGIIILSMHAKESYVNRALSAGALGYILKDAPGADIINAVRAVYRKEYFLSSKIKADVISAYLESKKKAPVIRGYDLLSEREQQVFRLIVEGNSSSEIADFLFISPKTIEKHASNIMKKLGVNGRIELLKYAVKIGIVDPALWDD